MGRGEGEKRKDYSVNVRNSLRTADAFPVVATGNASAVRRLREEETVSHPECE